MSKFVAIRTNKPYRTERMQCSDRWARKLVNGIEAYVALWFANRRDYYFEIIFSVPDDVPHAEAVRSVGSIADELVEVLDRHSKPGMEGLIAWGEFEPFEGSGKEDVA